MSAIFQPTTKTAVTPNVTQTHAALVQRRCVCAGAADCDCDKERPQMKLAVSRPGDSFEQEADRVAEQVMRMPVAPGQMSSVAPVVSRQTAPEIEEELYDDSSLLSISRKESGPSIPAVTGDVAAAVRSISGGGQPLSKDVRAFFEPRFQHDFGRVRVHTDGRAETTTKALNARAYTLGNDIAFAAGQYEPKTVAGRMLLAHELTHVLQQRDAAQTVMRACDCPAAGFTAPSSGLHTFLSGHFPHLKADEYCVTAGATPTYNCFAWSIGVTNRWVESEVDTAFGDNDGTLEFSDFDAMFATMGLRPITNASPVNPVVALYAKGSTPTHAALNTGAACGKFESKLGRNVRISHWVRDLEGGPTYGDINRFYVRA